MKQQLLLLLDGLDEVRAEIRDTCVAALNVFQQEESSEIVVTSRIKDYESLSNRLNFQSTICLKLLTLEQVHLYLDSTGFELTGLRTLIGEDRALQELTRSPLMLNIMTVAYQGVKIAALPQTDTTQLFNSYIDRMFQHRQPKLHYSKSVAIRWLVWLAQQMSQQSKTVFFIEQLQPSWLQTTVDKMTYRLGVILLGGVVC